MIFSTQLAGEAMMVIGQQFNKILAVDFEDDRFVPIKVDSKEWEGISTYEKENDKSISFSEWVDMFIESEGSQDLKNFPSCEELAKLEHPATFCYKKLIGDNFHEVRMEIIPTGDSMAYLYVIDMTDISHKKLNCNKEDCKACGKC